MAADQLLAGTPEAASPPVRAPLSWRPILRIAGTVAVASVATATLERLDDALHFTDIP